MIIVITIITMIIIIIITETTKIDNRVDRKTADEAL